MKASCNNQIAVLGNVSILTLGPVPKNNEGFVRGVNWND